MTKETKMGLLVGLGIILAIGIVVSDHMSVANRQTPPIMTSTGQQDGDVLNNHNRFSNGSQEMQPIGTEDELRRETQPPTTGSPWPHPASSWTPSFPWRGPVWRSATSARRTSTGTWG